MEIDLVIANFKIEVYECRSYENITDYKYRKIITPDIFNVYFKKTVYLRLYMKKAIEQLLFGFLRMPVTHRSAM